MTSIFDWDLSLKLAGNDMNHARTYLNLLIKDLKKHLETLTFFLNNHDYDSMKAEIHQLIGALSYCGATPLKKASEELYRALKTQSNINESFIKFHDAAKQLIDYTHHYFSTTT